MPEGTGKQFLVQWHLTARCDQVCKHCYVYDAQTYQTELSNELGFKECLKILDDLHEAVCKIARRELKIYFSGGDPLLCSHFWKLTDETKKRKIHVGILGNPHHITKDIAIDLHKLNIGSFQVSIDGLEHTHDQIRGKGSFEVTLQGIKFLKAAGISVTVMFTLSKMNIKELIEVAGLCSREKVNIFAFDSLIPMGNAEDLEEQIVTAQEMREIMYQYKAYTQRLIEQGSPTLFRKKGNLWTLIDQELGIETDLIYKSKNSKKICAGCPIGISTVSILSDGTVYPCRRLPIKIGKFPEQSFRETFFGHALQHLRQEHLIAKCSNCELFNVCRGCRALAYATTGDYFAPDPHCWKN